MESRRHFCKACFTFAGSLLAAACLSCRREKNEDLYRTTGERIRFQAAWYNDAEFTGYFAAIANGFYRDEGILLDYMEGGPEVIPEGTLLSNHSDIALTTPDTTINLINKENVPLRIIGTQYQKSPLGIVSLKKNNIRTPQDLRGKTVAVPPVNVTSLNALLKVNKVRESDVKIVPYQYDPTPLLNGNVDATVDFTTNVPFTIQSRGGDPSSFLFYDFGFTIYNDTVVVTEETLKNRRRALVQWLRASRRGWEEAFRYPDYPARIQQHFKGNGRKLDNEIFFNNAQRALIECPAGIFALTDEGIRKNINALKEVGLDAKREYFVTDLLGSSASGTI
jgi:ABC-type nitrate/sulfonate/bicarbonate transport system substrate-binding protein